MRSYPAPRFPRPTRVPQTSTNPLLWQPTATAIANSQLTDFTAWLARTCDLHFDSYAALHAWSIEDPGHFWRSYWQYAGLVASRFEGPGVEDLDHFPGARWFPQVQTNYAQNLLVENSDKPALVSLLENGVRRQMSYRELRSATAGIQQQLQGLDIRAGDRVAAWLPNIPETVAAMLACSSLGAVWSSCSPDFGTDGALDRFSQIEPCTLIACDGYRYAGREISIVEKVREVAAQVPSIKQVLWVPVLDTSIDLKVDEALLAPADDQAELTFAQLPFDHPLFILYSSGTTGQPKCIVHGQGGTLLQHRKEHQLHIDLRPTDTLFFFTTCGWMMWNWLVSALASRSTVVLYDGSPAHPGPEAMFDICVAEQVTVFGISAKFLTNAQKSGVTPARTHNLKTLRSVISTGSPLTTEGFAYVYADIKADCHLISMSGGTDLISCFMLGNPNQPVYAGELQSPGLGMAVEIWDVDGQPVRGEKGELVCTRPFPSAPIGFWNDPGDEKYLNAYFSDYPNIWLHGDYAEQTEHGGYVIHGRSDAVLNPNGVRIGTAEIYRQVETFSAIIDAVCVGQNWQDDQRVILFVVLKEGSVLDDTLISAVRLRIREQASPRHVPAKVLQVADIPRTMSGKIAEIAVRAMIHDEPVKNTSALANPEALELFRGIKALAD